MERKTAIEVLRNANLGGVLRTAADKGIEALEQMLPNDPLTLDELQKMDGEPVWIKRHDSHPINRWAIVGDFESPYGVYFGTALGGLRLPYEDYSKTWFAYRRKPEEGIP